MLPAKTRVGRRTPAASGPRRNIGSRPEDPPCRLSLRGRGQHPCSLRRRLCSGIQAAVRPVPGFGLLPAAGRAKVYDRGAFRSLFEDEGESGMPYDV